MLNLNAAVRQLKVERDQARARLEQLEAALKALGSVGGLSPRSVPSGTSGKRRTMSTAARKRIAAAQRARWAKWKAANKKR
jgi:hypothetical protein